MNLHSIIYDRKRMCANVARMQNVQSDKKNITKQNKTKRTKKETQSFYTN